MQIIIAHSHLNTFGGGERAVLKLLQSLSARHDVTLWAGNYEPAHTFAEFKDVPRRDISTLNEREILSLGVAAEEEDSRIYATYAEKLRSNFPSTAAVFDGMAGEEDGHRRRLLDLYVDTARG